MKILVKTINPNANLTFELQPLDTVGTIKAKIAEEKGSSFSVELQKLIRSGKILSDDSVTIESLNLSEKDFFVCMPTKPTKPSSSSSEPKEIAVPPPAKAAELESKPKSPEKVAPTSSSSSAEAFTTLATGSHLEQAVSNLMEMGYPKDKVVRAMRAAFNNPDRAAEYLLTDSIPEEAAPQPATPASAGTEPVPAPADSEESINLFTLAAQQRQRQQQSGASEAATGLGPLAALRNSPQFAQLRQLIQSNPALLEPLLVQMGAANPALLQALSSNPQAFAELLSGAEGADAAAASDDSGTAATAAPAVIQLTPEENEAIDRLTALGFDRGVALEAFLACDKNEELAANYLFDSAGFA